MTVDRFSASYVKWGAFFDRYDFPDISKNLPDIWLVEVSQTTKFNRKIAYSKAQVIFA